MGSLDKLFFSILGLAVIVVTLGTIVRYESEIILTFKLIPILFIALVTFGLGLRLIFAFWNHLQTHYLQPRI